jgi:hypothetical protein
MKNNIPSLIAWEILKSKLNQPAMTKVASKKKKESEYDEKGNKKFVTDAGGREFGPRGGLEGPFKTTSGYKGVYYYDPKEGKYYCPYTDMYLEEKPGSDSKHKTASEDLKSQAAKLGKNLGESTFDGNTPHQAYARIIKGYEDGDPIVMDIYGQMLMHDGAMQAFMNDEAKDLDDDAKSELEFAHQEAFWDRVIEKCKYQTEDGDTRTSSVYNVICKTANGNKNIHIAADSINEAFEKAEKYASTLKIDWLGSEVKVEKLSNSAYEFLKTARHQDEKLSLQEVANKVIQAAMTGSMSDFPVDQQNKLSQLVGQIQVLVNVMSQVTGEDLNETEVLDALSEAAAHHGVDLEAHGSPAEMHVLFPKEKLVQSSDDSNVKTAKKKKSKAGKNKPTNPSLWARAKAAAKAKFDVYPSAYANSFAVQWYKKHGGGWRKAKTSK